MSWTTNKFEITFQSQSILDFKERSIEWKFLEDTGGIWLQFGKLKDDKVPENQPLDKNVLFQISFDADNWKLQEAKKWFKDNEQMIEDKIALKQDSIDTVQAVRHDVSRLINTEITDQGYLKTKATLTRVGVFDYRNSDGTIRRELRLPEEVFKPVSMDSFANLAVTDDHPPVLLNSENTSQYSKGHTYPEVKRDGDHLTTFVVVVDEDTIKKVQNGKQELSNGYVCDLELSKGIWNGKKYDAIQRNIRGNHVAIVDKGRAGHSARLTLDNAEITDFAELVESDLNREDSHNNTKGNVKMAKLKIDGVEIEIDDSIVSVISTGLDKRDTAIGELETSAKENTAKIDILQAKVDAGEATIKQVKEDKLSDDEFAKLVNERADEKVVLLDTAKKLLSEEDFKKTDEMSDKDIKLACIAADPTLGNIKLDGQTDDYINAMFDMASANAVDRKDKVEKQVKTVGDKKIKNDSDEVIDSEQARLDMIEEIKVRSREVGKGA